MYRYIIETHETVEYFEENQLFNFFSRCHELQDLKILFKVWLEYDNLIVKFQTVFEDGKHIFSDKKVKNHGL